MGALGRYHLGRAITHFAGPNSGFPWGTLSVNVIGSLAMGLLVGWLARFSDSNELLRLLLGVGLLGGFTTFSAFSAEMVLLIQRGQWTLSFAYGFVSIIAGLTAMLIGLMAMRAAS